MKRAEEKKAKKEQARQARQRKELHRQIARRQRQEQRRQGHKTPARRAQTRAPLPPKPAGYVPEENLFNRASGRVHGYSSWLTRYLRLSISLRTSAGYSLFLLRMFVPLALLLVILFGFLQSPNYLERQRQALEVLPAAEVQGVEASLLAPLEEPEGFLLYEGWGVCWDTHPFRLHLQYVEPHEDGQARLVFSLAEDWRVLKGLLWGLLGMLLLISFNFLSRRRELNEKILQPINDITETAQLMNEKNLSARINVAGTQNELRDLAVIINDMLGRIEVAYNRQKQFVSDASHELRTPIAVIQGYAGLLERWGKDNPDVRDEAIAAITSETLSMKELVENLLFLARHDKKTLSLSFEVVDSREMLTELVRETELIAKSHKIVTGELAECTLLADRSTVKQAVRVFVENALKYTPQGGAVTLSSEIRQGSLHIAVTDTGPGIKKADLNRIFDRFYRADEARNSQTGGHGLGLAIARIIALSHGGKIHVRSKVGEGSVFTLALPITKPEETARLDK